MRIDELDVAVSEPGSAAREAVRVGARRRKRRQRLLAGGAIGAAALLFAASLSYALQPDGAQTVQPAEPTRPPDTTRATTTTVPAPDPAPAPAPSVVPAPAPAPKAPAPTTPAAEPPPPAPVIVPDVERDPGCAERLQPLVPGQEAFGAWVMIRTHTPAVPGARVEVAWADRTFPGVGGVPLIAGDPSRMSASGEPAVITIQVPVAMPRDLLPQPVTLAYTLALRDGSGSGGIGFTPGVLGGGVKLSGTATFDVAAECQVFDVFVEGHVPELARGSGSVLPATGGLAFLEPAVKEPQPATTFVASGDGQFGPVKIGSDAIGFIGLDGAFSLPPQLPGGYVLLLWRPGVEPEMMGGTLELVAGEQAVTVNLVTPSG